MGKRLYVGNLPFSATDERLMQMFQQAGQVESARIITDRDTGAIKASGSLKSSTEREAADAITKVNGADFEGRSVRVTEARRCRHAKEEGGGKGFGGGGDRGERG